ncbi:MAG: aminoglycoside phosphotransferase family protein [Bacteroidota bacterium]
MEENAIVLSGGMNTENVLKIGDEVHRTRSSNHEFIQRILRFLEHSNFSYSPRFLGIDQKGREILTFIEGEVPREFALSLQQKIDAIKILRKLHDVLAKCDAKGASETICHNDFAPWNIIVKNDKVVGVIDFDESAPGDRIDDIAYFIWTFLDLGVSAESVEAQIGNIAALVRAYGLLRKEELISAIFKQQRRILAFRKQIVASEEDEHLVSFSQQAIINIQKSIDWVDKYREEIEKAISA